ITFLAAQNGNRVGSGECTDAANEALRVAGGDFMLHDPGDGNYTWGTSVATITNGALDPAGRGRVVPGDIIQFWISATQHHTMVVAAVDAAGFPSMEYEQNWGGNRTLTCHDRSDILGKPYAGTITIYQPVERTPPPAGYYEFSIVNNTSMLLNNPSTP